MPKYRATIHVSGLSGDNPRAVRAALDAELGKSGLRGCRIVAIDIDAPPSPRAFSPARRVPPPARRPMEAGGMLLVAAAAAAIWFMWWMVTAAFE
jgi:hypothetical protein